METTQIERIRRMEALFDEGGEALRRLEQARRELEQARQNLERARMSFEQACRDFEAAQAAIAELEAYYASSEWRADFEADVAGNLPADLKRGVLSEDGIWDLLEEWKELKEMVESGIDKE